MYFRFGGRGTNGRKVFKSFWFWSDNFKWKTWKWAIFKIKWRWIWVIFGIETVKLTKKRTKIWCCCCGRGYSKINSEIINQTYKKKRKVNFSFSNCQLNCYQWIFSCSRYFFMYFKIKNKLQAFEMERRKIFTGC